MKPLVVLLLSFTISLVAIQVLKKRYDFGLSGRIAMSIMLIFTALGHFVFTKGMAMMIPSFLPLKLEMVWLTGVLEIVFALGLLFSNTKIIVGWGIIVFLLIVLPINIYGAMNTINYQKGTLDGDGISYLWFRVPLQLFFIIWVYVCAIRR